MILFPKHIIQYSSACQPHDTHPNVAVQVTMEAGKYLVEQFVVQGLVAAVALPMTVMSAANLIDTWWAVCLDRAEKAGKLLAHVLMSGAHGDRYIAYRAWMERRMFAWSLQQVSLSRALTAFSSSYLKMLCLLSLAAPRHCC